MMINQQKFTELLPKDRPYVPLEAAFCLQLDTEEKNPISISGYAKSWRWSRTKVRRFLEKWHSIEQPIEQPKEHVKKQPAKQAKGHTLATNTSQSEKNENMSKNMSKDMSKGSQENSKEDMVFPIKCELKKVKMKNRQLAERTKISESRLSSIIHGRIKPNHKEKGTISKVLGVSEDTLFGI
jgi:ribosome-binding protein aMBF1 (putative translation factor)